MSISAPFINRPIGTSLLAVGLAIMGMVAFRFLPVASLPEIDFPTISVQASMPGASPEIMATAIATPLEHQLGKISGVTELTSMSSTGNTRITLQFDLARNINGAVRDVQAAINAASSQLPSDLPNRPTYRKVNPADAPIMIVALTSDTYTPGQMYDIASTVLVQKISKITGVGQVSVAGGSLPAIRAELNPNALYKYGIGLSQVKAALSKANTNAPKGQVTYGSQTADIHTNDQLFKASEYMPLIVSYQNGRPVRLADVAQVKQSVEDIHNTGASDGQSSVVLVIFKEPGANVIETVDNLYSSFKQFRSLVPASVNMIVTQDRTTTIRASVEHVEFTLVLSMILVVMVVYAFLRSARSALVPSIIVPLALLGTFAVMYLLGYTLDNLSLMALTIATGFVVDDAVVVLENIMRYIEKGDHPLQAALKGASEVGFTVLSMSLSLIAVFIPLLFMQGIVGRLFREFAVTLSVSIIISLIISLTLAPMLCAKILKTKCSEDKKASSKKDWVELLSKKYQESLYWALNHPKLMLALTLCTVILNIQLFVSIPKGFFPEQDSGRIGGTLQAQQNIAFHDLKSKFTEFSNIIRADPAVEHVSGYIGGSSSTNGGSIFISLKPSQERKTSASAVVKRLKEQTSHIPGANVFFKIHQDLVIGGRQSNAQFQYTLATYDLDTLHKWVPKVMAKLADIPGIIDVNNDLLNRGLQTFIEVDRGAAASLGVNAKVIDEALYDAFGQRQVSVMYTPINQYHVIMGVEHRFWLQPQTLKNLYVSSSNGKQVPLSTVARFNPSQTLLAVNHQGQLPCATISFNLLPGVALGEAVKHIKQTVEDLELPKDKITGSFQGTAQAFQASLASEPYLIMAALIAVYIILGMLYESTLHPLTILSTLPSAGVGALLALRFMNLDLSIIALIGILLLIGIVKKNAIMMIDFALSLMRQRQATAKEAIFEASVLRFRPIMMTTMAAVFSAIPLASGMGVGGELRQPLGVAIIGGLLVSQVLTLYTTPVIYLALERLREYSLSRWGLLFKNPSNPPPSSSLPT